MTEPTASDPYNVSTEEFIAKLKASRAKPNGEATVEDFWAYMPQHRYLHIPTRELWPKPSVDGRVAWPLGPNGKPMPPSRYLDEFRPIEQVVWAPDLGDVVEDRVIDLGGWIAHPGCRAFNLYRAPAIVNGNAQAAIRWRDHLEILYPNEADHIVKWLGFKLQNPGVKLNHAIVLGGEQGIGKEEQPTMLLI